MASIHSPAKPNSLGQATHASRAVRLHIEYFMKKLKQLIKQIPILENLSIKVYRKFLHLNPNEITFWLEKYLPVGEAMIVQIGSNDGKTGDPIFYLLNKRKKWNAIFVEPVPYLFERLIQNYNSDPRFIFENVAINDGTEQVFYSVKQEAKKKFPDLPIWFDQLGSFDKENILKHLNGKLKPFIEENKLKGMTLTNLLSKNTVNSIDLLHIDTEGYDWKILSQLTLAEFKPSIILIEHMHLVKSEKKQSIEFQLKDYYIFDFGEDFLSIRKDVLKKRDLNKIGIKIITQSNNI